MSADISETPNPTPTGELARIYRISPKTPHSKLKEYTNPGGDTGLKTIVARDMITNARERD